MSAERAEWLEWGLLAAVLAAVAIPPAWPGLRDPEETLPHLVWLAGALALALVWAGRTWLPLGVLLAWASTHTALDRLPVRSLEVLAQLWAGALLYVAVRRWPARAEVFAIRAFAVALGANVFMGLVHLTGHAPGMRWVLPVGTPSGFLLHPNYWGAYLALGWPLLWAATAHWPGPSRLVTLSAGASLIALSGSRAAALAVLVAGVLLLPRRHRPLLVAGGLGLLAATWAWRGLAWHLGWSGGRWPVWRLGLDYWLGTAPWTGAGLGMWANFALWPEGPIHDRYWLLPLSEPVQLAFELGLLGLLAGAWCLGDWTRQAHRLWHLSASPWGRAWVAISAEAALLMWVTPIFHLPALAALVIVAVARVAADTGG